MPMPPTYTHDDPVNAQLTELAAQLDQAERRFEDASARLDCLLCGNDASPLQFAEAVAARNDAFESYIRAISKYTSRRSSDSAPVRPEIPAAR